MITKNWVSVLYIFLRGFIGLIVCIYWALQASVYCCYVPLFYLGASGAGWIEVGSPSCCGGAVRCLILRWWSVVVVVVIGVVGSLVSAGRGVPVLRVGWASSAGLSWQAPHLVRINDFSCVRCHNIFFLVCISFFVSVGWVSRRELGGILCATVSLDILLHSLP